ncbi:MAG: acyl-CoA dehydrogenase [Candidatus Eremiobacteraeota bacterium]|nr:acyl-CoA dehydrogenase [Candidatus Eremiobacteraeota bacterium]
MTSVTANGSRLRIPLEIELLWLARSDARGVPLAGRLQEIAALRGVGARDVSLGRLYEGHVNGVQLVARCGTAAQRVALERDLADGLVFGVWNTQDEDGVRIEDAGAGRYVLSGAKTWASGAGRIERPIVTAQWPDGGVRMCLVPMDRVRTAIDGSAWRPLGMHDSQSFRVDFDGVTLAADDLIGDDGDYERQPWFFAGALRYVAVQTGVIERLVTETAAYLLERRRDGDPFQRVRLAEMRIAARTALQWLAAGAAAWTSFDAERSESSAAEVIDVVDMARSVVDRAARETIDLAVRCVGARGLVEPLPFARLVRDLEMYLRQPAPDAALVRVGVAAFREVASARNAAIASSTGTGA